MPLIAVLVNVALFALVCLLIVLLIEWVASLFGVPGQILTVIRAIMGLLILLYLLGLLLGGPETVAPLLHWPR